MTSIRLGHTSVSVVVPLETMSVTVYKPGSSYTAPGFSTKDGFPLPKSHSKLVGLPVLKLVKFMVTPGHPTVWLAEKLAVSCTLALAPKPSSNSTRYHCSDLQKTGIVVWCGKSGCGLLADCSAQGLVCSLNCRQEQDRWLSKIRSFFTFVPLLLRGE